MCVFLHENSKSKRSRNMKLDYIVKYENTCFSDKFDIGHCRTKVKVTARLDQGQGHSATSKFFSFTAIQTVRSHNSTLVQAGSLY